MSIQKTLTASFVLLKKLMTTLSLLSTERGRGAATSSRWCGSVVHEYCASTAPSALRTDHACVWNVSMMQLSRGASVSKSVG